MILASVMDSIYDTLNSLLKGNVDKRTIFDNLELVLLTLDESIDQGHIVELDPNAITGRVLMRSNNNDGLGGNSNTGGVGSGSGGGNVNNVAVADMTISQALGLARDQFLKSLISSTTVGH